MKKLKGMLFLLILSILLTACQSGLSKSQTKQYGEEEQSADYDVVDNGPVSGGSLNLFMTVPDTLNPILTKNAYVSDLLGFIYEGLTSLDKKQQAVPILSDSWTVSPDGLIWDFHIRDGISWQDGQPFTAEDVEFTVQTILRADIDSVYKPLLQNIATYAAVGSSDFKLVLNKPNSFLPDMMTFPILPKHQFSQADIVALSQNFRPVGTGPYKFFSSTGNKQIVLKADKSWWYLNAKGADQKGLYIDTINISAFNKLDDAMGALQTGELDAVSIKASDFSKYEGRTDLAIKKYTSRDFEFLSLNIHNPLLSDRYARKAISLAINKELLIRDVLSGEAEPAELPILPESWISDLSGVSTESAISAVTAFAATNAGLIQNSTGASITTGTSITSGTAIQGSTVNDAESSAGTNASVTPAFSGAVNLPESEDIVASSPREALLKGKWKESLQGYYKVIGGVRRYLKVELIVNSNNNLRVRAAEKICEQLSQAGIPAVCTKLDWNEMLTRLNAGKYEVAFTGLRIPQIPDISYLYSAGYLPAALPVRTDNARNVSGYSNLQLDSYISAMFSQNTADTQKALYKAEIGTISKDTPYIGLYFTRDAMIFGRNIRGALKPDAWDCYRDICNWYKNRLH